MNTISATPLVTVGIPCYNVERFIGFAIHSVLNQTYTNFELIITDDGSTDSTVDIIKQFDDPRIKLIVDGENHGISYRLNQQIDMAQGEYFVRMDGDDIMFPDRIEKQIKYLQTNPDVSVVSGQAVIIDDDNKILGQRGSSREVQQLTLDRWKHGHTLIHPTVTGRLSFFKAYGYRDEYKGVEDVDLWMRACQQYKLVILPCPLMFYRDPLKFKLKTYLYRSTQVRKLFKASVRMGLMSGKELLKRNLQIRLRIVVATTFSFMKIDRYLISRRNIPISNVCEYNSILSKSIQSI